MPLSQGDDDSAVISTAEGIKQKVEQLHYRLQSCVETLELVSGTSGSASESRATVKLQRQQQQLPRAVMGNARYSGAGASQGQGTSSVRNGGTRDGRRYSESDPHAVRVASSGEGPPSDEAEGEGALAGDDCDAGMDAGVEDFDRLGVSVSESSRRGYGPEDGAQPSAAQAPAVSVGSALRALKQNLSPQVRTSLKGAHVPTHGEELRAQSNKAMGDSVQRRLMGRADGFHAAGSLELSSADDEAGPGCLRTGSSSSLHSQPSRLGPGALAGAGPSGGGAALTSQLSRSTLSRSTIPADVQPQAASIPARQTASIGMFRRTDSGVTASAATSRCSSLDAQRSAPAPSPASTATRSKIPPPPFRSLGGEKAVATAPVPVAVPEAGPGAVHAQTASELTALPSPALARLANSERADDSSRDLLRESAASNGSVGRGWRFSAMESGGTFMVSVGSGSGDDEEASAPTPHGRESVGEQPRSSSTTANFQPQPSSAANRAPMVGFVPPQHVISPSNSGQAQVIGFVPPGVLSSSHGSGGAIAAPVVGFVPPPEAFGSTRVNNTQAPVVGFVLPPEVLGGGHQSPTGGGSEPATGRGGDSGAALGFVPPVASTSSDPPRADPRVALNKYNSVAYNSRAAAAMPLRTAETVRLRADPAIMQLPVEVGATRASVSPAIAESSHGGVDSMPRVPSGEFSFGINSLVFSSTTKPVLRSSGSSTSADVAAGERPTRAREVDTGQAATGGAGGPGFSAPSRLVSGSSRLSRISSEESRDWENEDWEQMENRGPEKLPWADNSSEEGGEGAAAAEQAATAPGPDYLRRPPPMLRLASPRSSDPVQQGSVGPPESGSLSPGPATAIQAPSFSDYSRVANPAARYPSSNVQTTKTAVPTLLPPPPFASTSRVPSPTPSRPLSPPRSPLRQPFASAYAAALVSQAPASPHRTSNSGVSIVITEADIARSGGIMPALLELVRERFRQKGIQNLADLAIHGASAGRAEGGGGAPSSPALHGETLTERIVARVETFRSRRSSTGLVAALSSGECEEAYSTRSTGEYSGDIADRALLALHPSPTGRSPAPQVPPGASPRAAAAGPASFSPNPASSRRVSADGCIGMLRGSISSPPIVDLSRGRLAQGASPRAETLRTGTSKIPAPAQSASRTASPAAATGAAAGAAPGSDRSAAVAWARSPAGGRPAPVAASRQTSPATPASPSPRPGDAVGGVSPSKPEQATQTPPPPSSPAETPGLSPAPLGTARDFFLSTTAPAAAAAKPDASRATRGGAVPGAAPAASVEDKLLPPETPTICTAADFFRGAASRATINTSTIATPLRELPSGASFTSPFLVLATAAAASQHGRGGGTRSARETLNGTPSMAASRPRRQSASGRAAVSTCGLTGRSGGGRVVIDDEPVDLATRSSSRTLSCFNRRASAGASTGFAARVAFDDGEAGVGPSAGTVQGGFGVAGSAPARGLTREVLMHLADLPSSGRHAFETTTDEEREEQERQARRRARLRRASGPGEGRLAELSASAPQRLQFATTGPASTPSHHHNHHHAHFDLGAPMGPSGRSGAMPRQLSAVMAETAIATESPGVAAAPGDLISVPPLSLDAPDMPEPGGGDAAGCARVSGTITQLPCDTFFIAQSPAFGQQPIAVAAAATAGRRGSLVPAAGAAERGGSAPMQQLSRLSTTTQGLPVGQAMHAQDRRPRRRSTTMNDGDSWDSSSDEDGGRIAAGRARGASEGVRGSARRPSAMAVSAAGERRLQNKDADTRQRSPGRRRTTTSSDGAAAPATRRAAPCSDDDFDVGSVPYDVYELDDTDVPDLDEREPSASRGGALSPLSSAAVSVLSQGRVTAARAHRSVSEANSTKRLSSAAPLLTEEEEDEEEGGLGGQRGQLDEEEQDASVARSDTAIALASAPVTGRDELMALAEGGEVRRVWTDGGDGASTPNGTRIRPSLQRLIDMRAASPRRSRPAGGEGLATTAEEEEGEPCTPRAAATGRAQAGREGAPAQCAAALHAAEVQAAEADAPSSAVADGSRESCSASVTATAGGTAEADTAEREALLSRRRDCTSDSTPVPAQTTATAAAPRTSRLQQARPQPLAAPPPSPPIQRQGSGGSSDVPPEDPQALVSPNYTQDMAEEEYGWDVATGDADVDNLTTPRGRRTGTAVGTTHARRGRKPAAAAAPPALPYDPEEVPSAGVHDVSASYTGELEEQELRDVISELSKLLPTGSSPAVGSPGGLEASRLAEKEPSFSLEPLPLSRVLPSGASWSVSAVSAMTAAATPHQQHDDATVKSASGITESLFLALSSPRAEGTSKAAQRRPTTGSVGDVIASTTSPRSASVGRGSVGATDSVFSPVLSPSGASRKFISPPGSPFGGDANATYGVGLRQGSAASPAVPTWLTAALSSPAGSARAAIAEGPTATGGRRASAPIISPRGSSRRPSNATADGPAPSGASALADLLASLRPITKSSDRPARASAAAAYGGSGGELLSPPSRTATATSGPSTAAVSAGTAAQQSQQRRQAATLGSRAASEASVPSTRATSTTSEPDPELRRLLLSAWRRWYLRRCTGAAPRVSPARDGHDSDQEEEELGVVAAVQAQAQAQARLQLMAKAHAWASSLAWDGVASSPGMQEAANFSRLYITFTRWLGQARSTRQARPSKPAVSRWAERRVNPLDPGLPATHSGLSGPSYAASQISAVAAPAYAQPPRPLSAAPSSPSYPLRAYTSSPGASMGAARAPPSPVFTRAAASPPVVTTWPAALRTVLSPPPGKTSPFSGGALFAGPHPGVPSMGAAIATATVSNPATLLAGFGDAAVSRGSQNPHGTPTISRTSGVRHVPSYQQQHQQHQLQRHQPEQAATGSTGAAGWPLATAASAAARGPAQDRSALQRPLQPTHPTTAITTRPASPSTAALGSRGSVPGVALSAASVQYANQHSKFHDLPRGLDNISLPASSAPAVGAVNKAAAPPAADDLEAIIAMHLLNGLGAGSEGVIMAGLQLATSGMLPLGKGRGGAAEPGASPRRAASPRPRVQGNPPAAAAAQLLQQQGPAGSLKLRPASTGRLGAQRQLSLGQAAGGALGAGVATGGSILERHLLGGQQQQQLSLAAKIAGQGAVRGPGALAGVPSSPVSRSRILSSGDVAAAAGASQGAAFYGGSSRPASPARTATSRPPAESLRPQSPLRGLPTNNNIRASVASPGQLNLSYYGIK